nr:hypothetical protein [Gooseberry vein banding associated virus]
MSSWEDTSSKQIYKDAVTATNTLYTNGIGEGFVRPAELTGGQVTVKAIRQNNTLIELVVGISAKLDNAAAQFRSLDRRISELETAIQAKEAISLPESIVDDLTKEFAKLDAGTGRKAPKIGKKGKFFVWKDPKNDDQNPNRASTSRN